MKLLFASAALLVAACGAPKAPDIAVSDGWARATAPGQDGGALYLTIVNRGGEDRLVEVTLPRARQAMVHDSSIEGGVMRMRALPDGLAIPAATTVKLAPNGTHIMLTGLDAPLRPGERMAVTLRFAKSGSKEATIDVEDAAR